MATIPELEYALLAGDAYLSTRNAINRFPIPAGWTEDVGRRMTDDTTGFEARTFQKGSEIVISYSGTDPSNFSILTSPDGKTNRALKDGDWAEQLLKAARYYLDIKTANPYPTTITLTGHSLGGGLAALIAVFFDEHAQTFDQAPFAFSALDWHDNNAAILRERLASEGTTYADGLAKLDEFLQMRVGQAIPCAVTI